MRPFADDHQREQHQRKEGKFGCQPCRAEQRRHDHEQPRRGPCVAGGINGQSQQKRNDHERRLWIDPREAGHVCSEKKGADLEQEDRCQLARLTEDHQTSRQQRDEEQPKENQTDSIQKFLRVRKRIDRRARVACANTGKLDDQRPEQLHRGARMIDVLRTAPDGEVERVAEIGIIGINIAGEKIWPGRVLEQPVERNHQQRQGEQHRPNTDPVSQPIAAGRGGRCSRSVQHPGRRVIGKSFRLHHRLHNRKRSKVVNRRSSIGNPPLPARSEDKSYLLRAGKFCRGQLPEVTGSALAYV